MKKLATRVFVFFLMSFYLPPPVFSQGTTPCNCVFRDITHCVPSGSPWNNGCGQGWGCACGEPPSYDCDFSYDPPICTGECEAGICVPTTSLGSQCRAGEVSSWEENPTYCPAGSYPSGQFSGDPDTDFALYECCTAVTPAPPPPEGGPTIPVYDPGCGRGGDTGVKTALGCLPVSPQAFINTITPWAIFGGAGLAFLLGVYGSFMIVISAGNPEKMQAGKELITSAFGGLLLMIFSVFLLKFIGVDILKLFSP